MNQISHVQRYTALPRSMRARAALTAEALHARSRILVDFLDVRMEAIIVGWIAVVVGLGLAKVAFEALGLLPAMAAMLPFLLVAFAPIAGYRVAAGSFPRGLLSAQPILRLCRYGSWRQLDPLTARQSPAFGPTGFMASLLAGLLLNVPFRTFEFILAVPVIPPGSPVWAQQLLLAMTADVVIMNFFYAVCFVMALRSVPLFPRMLLFAWTADVVLQLVIARQVAALPDLPSSVATSLNLLLHGNVEKVMVSVFVWLPYLILSERVNVTFRQRIRTSNDANDALSSKSLRAGGDEE
ncbi:MAG: DUF2569 domain-containing protein [Novosphingobium sp.]